MSSSANNQSPQASQLTPTAVLQAVRSREQHDRLDPIGNPVIDMLLCQASFRERQDVLRGVLALMTTARRPKWGIVSLTCVTTLRVRPPSWSAQLSGLHMLEVIYWEQMEVLKAAWPDYRQYIYANSEVTNKTSGVVTTEWASNACQEVYMHVTSKVLLVENFHSWNPYAALGIDTAGITRRAQYRSPSAAGSVRIHSKL